MFCVIIPFVITEEEFRSPRPCFRRCSASCLQHIRLYLGIRTRHTGCHAKGSGTSTSLVVS